MNPPPGTLFRKATMTGLAFLLSSCAARHMPNWSEVQGMASDTTVEVQLYDDKAVRGGQKIKGRFNSATANSVTLRLKDGQTRTLEKSAVRKVLTLRPLKKRWPGWVALGVTFGVLQTLLSTSASVDNVSASTVVGAHGLYTFPISAVFFYGSRMEGIYEVPPEHRAWLSQGTDSPPTGTGKPEKSK